MLQCTAPLILRSPRHYNSSVIASQLTTLELVGSQGRHASSRWTTGSMTTAASHDQHPSQPSEIC